MELNVKDELTIRQHLDKTIDFKDLYDNYFMLDENVLNDKNQGFIAAYYYDDVTKDDRTLKDVEFASLIIHLLCVENEPPFVYRFVTFLKQLELKDQDIELAMIIAKNYDVLYFEKEDVIEAIKELIIKSHTCETDSKKEVVYARLNELLESKKQQCISYKEEQERKLEETFATYDFPNKNKYIIELYHILKLLDFNLDYLLANLPDITLVEKDYEALHGKGIVSRTSQLLEEYLLRDKTLSKYDSDLGTYDIYKIGVFKVPFTKEEFLASIEHNLENNETLTDDSVPKF